MMDLPSILAAAAAGTLLQLAMVVAGHQIEGIKPYFGPGGMLISLATGALFVGLAGGAWGSALLGSAIAGGACALIGIAVSYLLGDVPAPLMIFGTLGSAVAGGVGGALAKLVI
jgi:hypothetical protein